MQARADGSGLYMASLSSLDGPSHCRMSEVGSMDRLCSVFRAAETPILECSYDARRSLGCTLWLLIYHILYLDT